MRVVATLTVLLLLGTAFASAAVPVPVPIVSVLQPFGNQRILLGAAFSLASPNDPSDPYLIFGPFGFGSSLGVIRRSLVSAATTSEDFMIINDEFCVDEPSCALLTVVPFNNGAELCWINPFTAGCVDLNTGNVTWNKIISVTNRYPLAPAVRVGPAGPTMLWYQTPNQNGKHNNNYLIDLASGKMLNQTSLNPDLSGCALATTCVSSKLCVALGNPKNTSVIVGYSPLEPAQSLWVLPLPQSAYGSSNLAVGTAVNGNTMIVFADGTRVYGVDATLGVLKFNVTYSGAPYNPDQNYDSSAPFAGICGSAIVVLGSFHVYMLSLETGDALSSFAVTTGSVWQDFACYRDTRFYVGVGSSTAAFAFFGSVTASTATVTAAVSIPSSNNQGSQQVWYNDGAGTVFNVLNSVIAYNIETGLAMWTSTSYDGSNANPPVHAVGTSLYCFVGPNYGTWVQCVDAAAPAVAFTRNHSFTFGVTNDTVVTGPSAGDGACILDATTLELIVDTAVAAGDSHANSATDSNSGSSSKSAEFKTETAATPIIVTTPTGLEVAIIVATLQAQAGNIDCVRSYDRHSGALLWVHCIPTTVSATPVTSPSAVFVLDANSTMHAIDITTGTKLWSRVVPSNSGTPTFYGLPVFDRNFTMVFVASNDYFVAISVHNGDILWSNTPIVSSSQPLPPLVVNSIFYGCSVVATSGPLQCQRYDAVTGRNTSAVASILNPSSTPQLVEYDGRFFVNAMENTFVNGSRAGLYEIDFDNITRTRQVITLPPMSSSDSTVDAILVGIADGLVAFQIQTTDSNSQISYSLQVWGLHAMTVVWGLESSFLVGAVKVTIQPPGSFSNPPVYASADAGVLAVVTTDFIMVYDWHTGAVLRILPGLQQDSSKLLIAFTAAGNGTLLQATWLESGPCYLVAYRDLRTPQAGTTRSSASAILDALVPRANTRHRRH